jgi:hypothetical protein
LTTLRRCLIRSFKGTSHNASRSVIGHYEYAFITDFLTHFEKCLKRPFASSFSQAFSKMPKKAFEGIFSTFEGHW